MSYCVESALAMWKGHTQGGQVSNQKPIPLPWLPEGGLVSLHSAVIHSTGTLWVSTLSEEEHFPRAGDSVLWSNTCPTYMRSGLGAQQQEGRIQQLPKPSG